MDNLNEEIQFLLGLNKAADILAADKEANILQISAMRE